MRKVVAALAVAATVGGLAPIAAAAIAPSPSPARVADHLAASLAAADGADHLMVFVHGRSRQAALDAVRHAGLLQVGEFASIGVPVAVGTPDQIAALVEIDGVTYVEENRPVDPLMETARVATRADRAIETVVGGLGPFDGTGQTIAVVDGGVDGTHPMFADPETGASKVVRNLKILCFDHLPGVTFTVLLGADPATCPAAYTGYEEHGEDNEPFLVDMPGNDTDSVTLGGHGTHVAGIAAGYPVTTSDGRKLSGVAPGADIVALSMGVAVGIYGANAGLDWVARHHTDPCGDGTCPPITVVNNSYGGGGDFDPESVTSKLQARLVADGVTVVWANGNSGGDGTANASGRDAANTLQGSIAVANYDDDETGTRDGALAESSSRGLLGDPKTWPDLSAPGTDITSACRPYLAICASGDGDLDYGTISGTSMASPHVAGAVAVLQQAAVAATGARLAPAAVEAVLEDTAHKLAFGGDYAPDPDNGDDTSSFDKGHGLLDLEAAVRRVLGADAMPGIACAPGAPLVADASGDTTVPTLDVERVDVLGQPERKRFVVRITVDEVAESGDESFVGSLSIGDALLPFAAARGAFTVDGEPTSGTFDAGRDEVRFAVPRGLVGRGGPVAVKGIDGGSAYRDLARELADAPADEFAGGCATLVDLGPPIVPDGSAEVGKPFRWEGEPTTAASDPVTGSSVTFGGTYEDVRRVEVRGGTRVAFEVSCGSPLDDYDITLTGPDGKPVGKGTDVGRSANPGCAEKIVVANAKPGVYTATVVAYATLGGTYAAELRVK